MYQCSSTFCVFSIKICFAVLTPDSSAIYAQIRMILFHLVTDQFTCHLFRSPKV